VNLGLIEKAEQVLKIRKVSDIYKEVLPLTEAFKPEAEPMDKVYLIKEILFHLGEGAEIETRRKAYNDVVYKKWPKPYTQEEAEIFLESLHSDTEVILLDTLELALRLHSKGRLKITWPEGLEPEAFINDLIAVGNSPVHYGFRHALARGQFDEIEQGWPAADISGKTFKGKAYFKEQVSITTSEEYLSALQETMKEKVLGLGKHGDLCADIFDIITAKWLKTAQHEQDTVKISADEFLLARGLKARLQVGKRGGFEEEQRRAIQEQIEYLDQAWVTVREMDVIRLTDKGKRKKEKWREDKKALIIEGVTGQERLDGRLNIYQWEVKPGAVFAPFLFGPGRQTALLSCKALQYDFYRQKWEKRIARYLAWIWRINRSNRRETLRVEKLLEAAAVEIDKNRPGRTRDRLHKALNQLKEDGIITAWKEDTDEGLTARRGWWREWLESKVIITAPKEILQHYEQIECNRQKQLKGKR